MSLPSRSVLFVDDDDLFADATADVLRARGYEVQTARSLGAASALNPASFDCVVVDHNLPDGKGISLATQLEQTASRVVLVSADPPLDAALEAVRLGVSAFLHKPVDIDVLVSAMQNALGTSAPAFAANDARRTEGMLPSQKAAGPLLQSLGRSLCPVLITGETGTGKGHLARAIHASSKARRNLVPVNCAALPSSIVEAELFGVEQGAYTGAESRPGLIELADGGTLFLDEIGELPMATQAKLLGFLDDGLVRRVGGSTWKHLSVRIIAATNRELEAEVERGGFRADLLHRLDVARIELAPLRERTEDLPLLVSAALERLSARDGVRYFLARGELERLGGHAWPGNVRELQNTIERSTLVSRSDALLPSLCVRSNLSTRVLPALPAPRTAPELSAADDDANAASIVTLDEAERLHVMRALTYTQGNRARAASLLGVGVSTLRRKMKDWAIE